MGLTGWLVMATFWVAVVGLVIWAVTRLAAPGRHSGHQTDRLDLDSRDALD